MYVVEHELSEFIAGNCHVTFHLYIAVSGKAQVLDSLYLLFEYIFACLKGDVGLAGSDGCAEFGGVLYGVACTAALVVGRIPARVTDTVAHCKAVYEGVVTVCGILDRVGAEHDAIAFGCNLAGDHTGEEVGFIDVIVEVVLHFRNLHSRGLGEDDVLALGYFVEEEIAEYVVAGSACPDVEHAVAVGHSVATVEGVVAYHKVTAADSSVHTYEVTASLEGGLDNLQAAVASLAQVEYALAGAPLGGGDVAEEYVTCACAGEVAVQYRLAVAYEIHIVHGELAHGEEVRKGDEYALCCSPVVESEVAYGDISFDDCVLVGSTGREADGSFHSNGGILTGEYERVVDHESLAEHVWRAGCKQGDGFLLGRDCREEFIDALYRECSAFFGRTACRLDCECCHTCLGHRVVDVVLVRVCIYGHLVAARIEHAYGGLAYGIARLLAFCGLVGRIGLAVEYDRVAACIFDRIPADNHVLRLACGHSLRVGLRLRGRKSGVDVAKVGSPGKLCEADWTAWEDIDKALLGDVLDDNLLGLAHVAHCGCTALYADGAAAERADTHDEVVSCSRLIDRLDDQGTRVGNLECKVTVGRNALAGGYGCGAEAEHALAEGDLVGAYSEEQSVTDLGLGEVGREVFRVVEVPGVGTLDGGHSKVFRSFHILDPPLGCAYAGTGYLAVAQDVELSCLGVVARVCKEGLSACLANAEQAVEEGFVAVPEPVVGCCEVQVVTILVLGVLTGEGGLLRHVQEEVLLEAEACRSGLEGNDAAVVGVVHE